MPSVIPRNPNQPHWTPKYPDFATAPEGRNLDAEEQEIAESNRGIDKQDRPAVVTPAPATSHLEGFMYQSKEFNSPYQDRFTRLYIQKSVLHVWFKPSGKYGRTHYKYFYESDALGESHFDALRAADHPGQVVNDVLIAQRIPYERVS